MLIQYSDDDVPELWQERLLAGRMFEDVNLVGDNIRAIRKLPADRRLPRMVRAEDCYLVFVEGMAAAELRLEP